MTLGITFQSHSSVILIFYVQSVIFVILKCFLVILDVLEVISETISDLGIRPQGKA